MLFAPRPGTYSDICRHWRIITSKFRACKLFSLSHLEPYLQFAPTRLALIRKRPQKFPHFKILLKSVATFKPPDNMKERVNSWRPDLRQLQLLPRLQNSHFSSIFSKTTRKHETRRIKSLSGKAPQGLFIFCKKHNKFHFCKIF